MTSTVEKKAGTVNIQTSNVLAPASPSSLEDVAIPIVMQRDILLKTIFRKNLTTVSEMAKALFMPLHVSQELLEMCRSQKLVEAMGNLHAGSGTEMAFTLSETGRARAIDALSQSEYYGAMPVPLAGFYEQSRRQSVKNIRITRERLEGAMGHMILPDGFVDALGPAVSSGRSLLLYGPPGNGKSTISEGIRAALGDLIYVPIAVEYAGQVITVYDPIVHEISAHNAEDPTALRRRSSAHDPRYVLCKRPAVMTGGELTLDMLSLNYNKTARTYQASLQMKATGGVFIVDDLGRQEEPPQALINRWIVPMEAGYDILALQSGEKFEVPFDNLVIFSTNFHPNELFDDAALRRIFFKVKIDGPTQEEFLKVFAMVAKKKKMPLDEASLIHLLQNKYPEINYVYANFHGPFLIDQIIAICEYEGVPYQMNPDYIDRAWANLYVKDG
ncbi:MAG: hypothetical protein ACJAXU_001809 [Paracoccaceae bacterium]